ncbi:response regulator [Patescibacteria group bacterium]|nr:response regulator [Patescibacteria group bacterium]
MRILISDDDTNLRNLIRRILQNRGYEVEGVENGQDLIDTLHSSEKFDLLITDNDMPAITGIEAIRRIRADVRHEKLQIILFSGNAEHRPEVRKLGGEFVDKAERLANLLSIVDEINSSLRSTCRLHLV